MRHQVKTRKLGRPKKQRNALLSSLATSLIEKGRISTTRAKAKELRPYIERIVTKAKADTLSNRRHVLSRLGNNKKVVAKLFSEIAPRMKERPGGYTRIIKRAPRKSDAAQLAIIEFVE